MPNVDNLNEYVSAIHFGLAKYYRPEDMYVANLLTAVSCIDSGITTLIDSSHNARSPEHTDACIDALEHSGIRALHAPGRPLAGDWAKHWPQDLERLLRKRFSSDDSKIALGIVAQPDKDLWRLARKLGLRIITEFLGAEMAAILPDFRREGCLGQITSLTIARAFQKALGKSFGRQMSA